MNGTQDCLVDPDAIEDLPVEVMDLYFLEARGELAAAAVGPRRPDRRRVRTRSWRVSYL